MNMANKSAIASFYQGRNLFITGATGFLGKALVEKILRSCPRVGSVYCLMRPKKNQDPETRFDHFLGNKIFDRIRHESPDSLRKIQLISGDILEPNLGISREDREILTDKVDVVFHSAATVKFTEPLKFALEMNTLGTRKVVNLCNDMKQIKAFVHISTAYSNCPIKNVEEKVYPPPDNPDRLAKLSETFLNDNYNELKGIYPNTYTFTKAMAEHVTKTEISKNIPTAIIRPAIVTAALREPFPGWIDNYAGVTGALAAQLVGTNRTQLTDTSVTVDLVPVDLVVNTMITAAADVNLNQPLGRFPVYHSATGASNPVKWNAVRKIFLEEARTRPTRHVVRYPATTHWKSSTIYHVTDFFEQFLPALLADTQSKIMGKKSRAMKSYRNFKSMVVTGGFFTAREWNFGHNNLQRLIDSQSKEDRLNFCMDPTQIQWADYFRSYADGIKTFLFNEDPTPSEAAKQKLRKLYVMHLVKKGALVLIGVGIVVSNVELPELVEVGKLVYLHNEDAEND